MTPQPPKQPRPQPTAEQLAEDDLYLALVTWDERLDLDSGDVEAVDKKSPILEDRK